MSMRMNGPWLPPVRRDVRVLEARSEEHTSELQSLRHLVCRLLPPPRSTLFPYPTLFRSSHRWNGRLDAAHPRPILVRPVGPVPSSMAAARAWHSCSSTSPCPCA